MPAARFNNNNNNGRSRLVGGQAGVNWQINQFVLGIEGDGDAVLGNNRNGSFPGGRGSSSTGFFGTVRGRAGVAFDRFLVYGTGGVAFGGNTMPNTVIAAVPVGQERLAGFRLSSPPTATITPASATLSVQVLNTPSSNNWSVKVEYLYVDLGRNNRAYLARRHWRGLHDQHRETNHIIRAGLNYRFDWGGAVGGPVVARY